MSAPAPRPEVRFFCVTGRDYFPGAVALLNSLRLAGHREPLELLDCGLEPWQRELLAPHAEIAPGSPDTPPSLQKLKLPLAFTGTAAILDADVIVTRRLDDLIEQAGAGRLVAFRNEPQRHFAEWADLLGLAPVPSRPYFSTSAMFAGPGARHVLEDARERLGFDHEGTWLGRGDESHPLYYGDQDVINAVAAAQLAASDLLVLERRLAAESPFPGLRLVDAERLHCAYADGAQPYLLHHWTGKPWLVEVRRNLYIRLLRRLLLGPDVTVRLEPERLPTRLRDGARGWLERTRIDVVQAFPGAARRIRRRRTKGVAWPS